MEKILAFVNKYSFYIGMAFTALVVSLLVYGHVFGKVEIPQTSTWSEQPGLHICTAAPEWAQAENPALGTAQKWWSGQGWRFREVRSGPCPQTCEGKHEDRKITVSCFPGWITLDLRGQWWDEEHAGVCVRPHAGEIEWAAIQVPSVLLGSEEVGAPALPIDSESLILAHEIGHCLAGLDHNQGPPLVPGVRLNPKTGSVMNPHLTESGWDDEGIPHGEW